MSFPDSRWPENHYTQVVAGFILPPNTMLTQARLDSALANSIPITVDEMYSDVLMLLERTTPTKAWVRREQGAIHVHIEGAAALRELRRPQSKAISLSWCDGDQPQGYAYALLQVP